MYHFVVVKKEIAYAELEAMSRTPYPEPHILLDRRRLARLREEQM